MLVLTRGKEESIFIGDDIEVRIISVDENRVRIGIEAPKDVRIVRDNAKNKSPKIAKQ